jgi:hypothetical protein
VAQPPLADDSADGKLARFVETEHKALGDAGSGGAVYREQGLELTHGDLVMLSGDHFSQSEIFWLWGNPSSEPGQLEGTQDELIYALYWQLADKGDTRFQPGGSWHGINFSDKVEKRVKARYYELAGHNAMHFVDPGEPGFGTAGFPPGSAGATYHQNHEKAIVKAYEAGTKGENDGYAKAFEATGQHFLTDSFAAGHLSTRRSTITEYWDGKYPDFKNQFARKVAHDMAVVLNDESTGWGDVLGVETFETHILGQIQDKIGSKPLSFGAILAVTVHAYDNQNGLWVMNDLGWRWKAWGDSGLDISEPGSEHSNREVATLAVQLGLEDISTAYAMGTRDAQAPLDAANVLDQVKQQPGSPAAAGDKYGPEQLMPRLDDRLDQGDLGWNVDSLQTLWTTPVRGGSPITFGEFISNDMQPGGSMGDELEDLHNQIDEEVNALPYVGVVLRGKVYPRRAFEEAVLHEVRIKNRCLAFLLEAVSK